MEWPDIGTLAVVVLAMCLLVLGYYILNSITDKENTQWREYLGDHVLQVGGLTFILPVIMVISVAIHLESQAITALLGAIIGSIFGSAAAAAGSSKRDLPNQTEADFDRFYRQMRNELSENLARSDRRFQDMIETLASKLNMRSHDSQKKE